MNKKIRRGGERETYWKRERKESKKNIMKGIFFINIQKNGIITPPTKGERTKVK